MFLPCPLKTKTVAAAVVVAAAAAAASWEASPGRARRQRIKACL